MRSIGRTAYFTCKSDEEVKWLFDRKHTPHNGVTFQYGKNVYVLKLMNITKVHEGRYTCDSTIAGASYTSDGTLYVTSKSISNSYKYNLDF